jgi:hypothetical protein
MIIAIDPGPSEHGVVWFENGQVVLSGNYTTGVLMPSVELFAEDSLALTTKSTIAIEWIESFGMAVGQTTFRTVYQIGRLHERFPNMRFIPRRDIKLHLCGSPRAKDANIRQALIDKLGPVGTKKNPGPCFGISSHLWSALAVAVTASELKVTPNEWVQDVEVRC